jgi:thiamine-phosphate pyrophosphorylase
MCCCRSKRFVTGLPPLSPEAENGRDSGAAPPIVCYVTDRKALAAADPIAALKGSIRGAIAAGVDWVQIREKDLSARELLALAQAAIDAATENRGARPQAARIVINGRLDVALAAGAAGVHLGSESLAAADVVRWCRSGNAPAAFLIGVSCHGISEVQEAEAAGANYAVFGPVFDTPSKRLFGTPQGITKLTEACHSVRIPVIAIGGVDEKNATECLRAGAAGIGAIRFFQNPNAAHSLADSISRLHRLRRSA